MNFQKSAFIRIFGFSIYIFAKKYFALFFRLFLGLFFAEKKCTKCALKIALKTGRIRPLMESKPGQKQM